ncbi:natriuretic peptides A-like [Carettochelys insculpta]|uniref:natriuretic peptides A-like n=1 Tax=Carettochelys insculpta TaxID=44489 RepID=UPI003EB82E79
MGLVATNTLRFLLLLLLFTMKPQGRLKAHPMPSSALAAELADFKTLLDSLEDKIPSEEAGAGLSPEMNEPNEEAPGDDSQPLASWNKESIRPPRKGLAYGHNSWEQPEKPASALRSQLRALLNSPRSTRRFSDCFGQRIDRIGAQSGLGCNSYRF